ncbi:NUDIX domain-containing protein [Streptomyces jumonjinensis]|uniref:NUDIX domain-containing protein n=1 Tax=Streptomyces jumonjinensis TaxID=1945 RepID=UPI00379E8E73
MIPLPEDETANPPARIQGVETLADDWFILRRYTLQLLRHDGDIQQFSRLSVECGDRASALLYSRSRGTVLLTDQFRLPAFLHGDPSGALFEIPGGLVGERAAHEAARREVEEEAGYRVKRLDHLATVYLSPQLSAERTHLFAGEYSPEDRVGAGGGIAEDGEDNKVFELSLDRAVSLVLQQPAADAKTLLLLFMARSLGLLTGPPGPSGRL